MKIKGIEEAVSKNNFLMRMSVQSLSYHMIKYNKKLGIQMIFLLIICLLTFLKFKQQKLFRIFCGM